MNKKLCGKTTQQAEEMLAKLTSGPKAFASLERLRDEQPAVFWRMLASQMPKQVETEANLSGNVEFHMIWAGDDSMTPGLK